MFRHRHRRSPLTDVFDWTDYHWDGRPWRGPVPPPLWANRRPRGLGFARLLLAGLAVVAGLKLINGFRSSQSSWLKKGLYAALFLAIAAAISGRSHRNRW